MTDPRYGEEKISIVDMRESTARGIWKIPSRVGRESSRLNITRRLNRAERGGGEGRAERDAKGSAKKSKGTKRAKRAYG